MFFDLNNLLGFMGAIAVMTVTPGLAAALVLQAASKGGFKSALATTWGVGGALAIWGIIASVGLGTFLVHYPVAFLWIRRLGSLYLAFIGLRILYGSFKGKQREQALEEDTVSNAKSLFAYACDSFLVMVLTPEIGVFDATFFPQFMTKGQDFFLTGLLYTVIEVVLALIWQTFLGGLGSSWKVWHHPRFQVYADRVFGVVLLLLAARGWK